MRLQSDISSIGSRPYPLDRERRKRVMVALAEKEMTSIDLSKKINLPKSLVSMIINGRRLSPKTEKYIADFLGKPVDYLFPDRTNGEIYKMRQAENVQRTARKGNVA